MDTTTQTANPVTRNTRAALLILEHSERANLPMPFSVDARDWRDEVNLQFSSIAALTEWALWLDAPIGEHATHDSVHHRVRGHALDHPVRCVYIAPLGVEAGRC